MPADRRTRWGWHQLADGSARRLVAASGVQPGDLVLDIGAGTGALTVPLVAAGARVIAFELHPRRAQQLRERFPGPSVKVVQVDAADLRLPRRPFRVWRTRRSGSRPRSCAGLLSRGSRLVAADLVVPRHVAVRWASGRGAGAHQWSARFDARIVAQLPRSAFRRVRRVNLAVLRLERRA